MRKGREERGKGQKEKRKRISKKNGEKEERKRKNGAENDRRKRREGDRRKNGMKKGEMEEIQYTVLYLQWSLRHCRALLLENQSHRRCCLKNDNK
jgi:hypothetical protein